MNKKIIFVIIRAIIISLALSVSVYILYKYEYFHAFGDVDNIIGAIPIALVLIWSAGITVLLWMKHTKRSAPVSAALAFFAVLSIVLFPVSLRGNWRINMIIPEQTESKPDLSVYVPFSENSKTAKLNANEESTLTLSDNLPVLDGATALYPVYAAFAETVYAQSSFTQNFQDSQDYVLCTNTRNAYEAVISGKADIIFAAGASRQQIAAAKSAGADLHFTPVGREAFVFLVGKDNPVDNITYQQIRNIYSGKTAEWSTLGWTEGGRIIAFQRPEGSGSQTGLQNIMGSLPIQVPQPLPDASLTGTNSLMKQISAEWKGVQPAIGYSYKYYATVMYANPDAKILKVNGTEPSTENIRNGTYPFTADFYAVTNGEPNGNAKLLIDWILSPQGQEIIEKTGYTPIK